MTRTPSQRSSRDAIVIGEGSFRDDTTAVLGQLRQAFAQLLADVGKDRIRRAADLQHTFGIDAKLAWQVFRTVNAPTPMEAGPVLPNASALKRFIRAAERHGARRTLIESGVNAVDRFEVLVKEHAGDREVFDSIVSNFAPDNADQLEIGHRRALCRSYSHVLGMSAAAKSITYLLRPTRSADDVHRFDLVLLEQTVGLKRLRPSLNMPISRQQFRMDGSEGKFGAVHVEPLDPETQAKIGGRLIAEFSTQPFPQLRTRSFGEAHTLVEVVGDDVGNNTAATYTLGHITRNLPQSQSPSENGGFISRCVATPPCEIFHVDYLIHRSFGRKDPVTQVLAEVSGMGLDSPVDTFRELAIEIPTKDVATYVGSGVHALHTTHIPNYTPMLEWGCERTGWDLNNFDVYRCTIEYPVPFSTLMTTFEIHDGNAPDGPDD